MQPLRKSGLVLLLVSFALPVAAPASNWQWLNDTAVKSFSGEDWKLLGEAARTALDQYPDDATLNWSNPVNDHSGSITIEETAQTESTTCRRAVFRNQAAGATGSTRVNLCRQPDGSWKIATPATAGPPPN